MNYGTINGSIHTQQHPLTDYGQLNIWVLVNMIEHAYKVTGCLLKTDAVNSIYFQNSVTVVHDLHFMKTRYFT